MTDIKLEVQRYTPGSGRKPSMALYEVPMREGLTVLDALLFARDYLDHSIGVRFSCRQASCGSCGMKINGRPRLACYTPVKELGSDRVVVQPLDNFEIVKDLVTDLGSFFEKHTSLTPHIVRKDEKEFENPTAEYLMTPKELEEVLQFTYCIKCGLCTSSCPTVGTDSLFPGPQAMAQAYRYTMDVRDEGGAQRIEELDSPHGIWRCHFAGSCSAVCPKGVDPALGIQLLRKHVMSAKAPRGPGQGAKVAERSAAPAEKNQNA